MFLCAIFRASGCTVCAGDRMNIDSLTRRLFLQASGGVTGNSLLRAALPGLVALAEAACSARDEAASFAFLGDLEAIEFAAIAARIMPTTDSPGANEAGVIYFMDQAFGSLMQDRYPQAVADLAELQQDLAASFPGRTRFSELQVEEQDRYLATRDETGFFHLMRRMTIFGFFGMQDYGGNHGLLGWQLLGFVAQHAWQAPFGHYDAETMHGEQNGE